MNEILLVILKVLPIILLLLLGVWMRKTRFISAETIRGIKRFLLAIAVPALLFLTFFRATLEPELLILSVVIFVVCALTFALGFLIKRLQKSDNPFYPSLFTTYLTGPLGFPLFIAYFGVDNLYRLAILDVGNSVFIFTALTVFLSTVSCSVNATERKRTSEHLRNLVHSPLTVSMFLGIAVSLTGHAQALESLPAVAALLEALTFLANASVPLVLIIVGYELPFDFGNFRATLTAVLLRLAIMLPIAFLINTFVIVRWLGLDPMYQAALYTLLILPPPFIIPLSIIGECDHKKYVLEFISLHMMVSMIGFVILMALI